MREPKDRTQSEQKRRRSLEDKPDLTYDLDGDGAVGAYDMALSTRFDLDKDGKLNAEERKNAFEQIKNGFMN